MAAAFSVIWTMASSPSNSLFSPSVQVNQPIRGDLTLKANRNTYAAVSSRVRLRFFRQRRIGLTLDDQLTFLVSTT